MTSKELNYMGACIHRRACSRLVTLRAPMYTDDFDWCLCATCPYHKEYDNKDITKIKPENIELKKIIQETIKYMNITALNIAYRNNAILYLIFAYIVITLHPEHIVIWIVFTLLGINSFVKSIIV